MFIEKTFRRAVRDFPSCSTCVRACACVCFILFFYCEGGRSDGAVALAICARAGTFRVVGASTSAEVCVCVCAYACVCSGPVSDFLSRVNGIRQACRHSASVSAARIDHDGWTQVMKGGVETFLEPMAAAR